MEKELEIQKKKEEKKLKLIKDFSFLLKHKSITVNEYCVKYLIEEG